MSFSVPHIDASIYPTNLQVWIEFEELVFHLTSQSKAKIIQDFIPNFNPLWREAAGSVFIEAAKLNTQFLHDYVELWKTLNIPNNKFNFCKTFANEILPNDQKYPQEELKCEGFIDWNSSPILLSMLIDDVSRFEEIVAEMDIANAIVKISNRDMSLLDASARLGAFHIFLYLLDHEQTIQGKTCRFAAEGGNMDIIKTCFKNGFSFRNYLQNAIFHHNYDVCNWIIDNCGADEDMYFDLDSIFTLGALWYLKAYDLSADVFFPMFARFGMGPVVEYLIQDGVNIDADYDDNTALTFALGNNHAETARCLIERGADIEFPDDEYECPLTYAVRSGNLDLVKLLIDKGVNIHRESCSLFNALRNRPEILTLLIERGLEIKGLYDSTSILHLAAMISQERDSYLLPDLPEVCDVIRIAIQNGADKNLRDGDGKTPIEIAKQNGINEIISALE